MRLNLRKVADGRSEVQGCDRVMLLRTVGHNSKPYFVPDDRIHSGPSSPSRSIRHYTTQFCCSMSIIEIQILIQNKKCICGVMHILSDFRKTLYRKYGAEQRVDTQQFSSRLHFVPSQVGFGSFTQCRQRRVADYYFRTVDRCGWQSDLVYKQGVYRDCIRAISLLGLNPFGLSNGSRPNQQ
jgi:hypothetical protein